MKLSVIIPVYNEASTIADVVERVRALPWELQIIIVDDGSEDGSRDVVQNLTGDDLEIVLHDRNYGKGAALRSAFGRVRGDIAIIQDADFEYNPDDIPRVIKPIQDGLADVVFGTRFLGAESHRVLFFWHSIGNRALTTLSNMLTDLNLTDMEVGYKAFRREVVQNLKLRSDRFGCEPEMTAKVARNGWRIYEVPISYAGRDYAEGKKITWKDGVAALYWITRFRFFD